MNELSLHILDIVQNSIAASAKHIVIEVTEDTLKDRLDITISDDGCGMSPEFVDKVIDPFITTRTTRKVGLGIPLLKFAAELTGGSLTINSRVGEGTTIQAVFSLSHIDRPPLGDMAQTMTTLIISNCEIDFIYRRTADQRGFSLNTIEIKAIMGDVPINSPDVLMWVKDYIEENEKELNGGA